MHNYQDVDYSVLVNVDARQEDSSEENLRLSKKEIARKISNDLVFFETLGKPYLDTKTIVRAAVRKNPTNFQFVSRRLLTDQHFILSLITEQSVEILRFIPRKLIRNAEFMIDAFHKNPNSFGFSTFHLHNHKTFMLNVLKKKPKYFRALSPRLKNSASFILNVSQFRPKLLKWSSLTMRDNDKFMLGAIRINKKFVKFASERLLDKREFVLKAIEKKCSIKHISDNLKTNEDIIMAAITNHPNQLVFASENFRSNKQFMMHAITECKCSLKDISPKLREDKQIVQAAITNNPYELQYAAECFVSDKHFMLQAIEQFRCCIVRCPSILTDDFDIASAVAQKNPKSFRYLSKRLRDEKELILIAVQNCQCGGGGNCVIYSIDDDWKYDYDVMLSVIKHHPSYFKGAPTILRQNINFMSEAVLTCGLSLRHFPFDLFKHDEELKDMIWFAIKRDTNEFFYVPHFLRNDEDLFAFILEQDITLWSKAATNEIKKKYNNNPDLFLEQYKSKFIK